MKPVLLFLVICIFYAPYIHAQTYAQGNNSYALADAVQHDKNITYSSANFVDCNAYRRPGRKTGGIIALSGVVVVVSGGLLWSLGSIQTTGPPNYGMQDVGIGLMAAGGVAAIIGSVIVFQGKREDMKRYGWQIVAPKRNELGIAYNF